MTHLSGLARALIPDGGEAAQARRTARDLAQHAERWGYRRSWGAAHHNRPGMASAATAVRMGDGAAGTATIRVGAGGVMLPHPAPLGIAEQCGPLAALSPGRIDLGGGRAPGPDPMPAYARRRTRSGEADAVPRHVRALQLYVRERQPGQPVHAVPLAQQRLSRVSQSLQQRSSLAASARVHQSPPQASPPSGGRCWRGQWLLSQSSCARPLVALPYSLQSEVVSTHGAASCARPCKIVSTRLARSTLSPPAGP
jgi:alkanesulfonate monooxygenase SsuD/methylene tetrahydromethanopterin reductase-like flavin-dependent oxidoreductase (luciferase family)